MVEKMLFIEGDPALREGFAVLLSKKLGHKMPRIKMGENQKNTIKAFMRDTSKKRYVLVDLDASPTTRETRLQELETPVNTFFMIQEMEAWFLSQPAILDTFYSSLLSEKIPKKNPQEIEKPSKKLQEWTHDTAKQKYHKVKHAVPLLKQLDPDRLEQDFQDFKNLIAVLREG